MDTLIFTHILAKPVTIKPRRGSSCGCTPAPPASPTSIRPARWPPNGCPAATKLTSVPKPQSGAPSATRTSSFPNRAQAEQWADGRDDIAILPIQDAFTVARDMAGALLRYEPEAAR